jgi:hypothetical protein
MIISLPGQSDVACTNRRQSMPLASSRALLGVKIKILTVVVTTMTPGLSVTRTTALNDTLENAFQRLYPGFRSATGDEAI